MIPTLILITHICAGYGFVFLGSEQAKVPSSFFYLFLSGDGGMKIGGETVNLARCGLLLPTYFLLLQLFALWLRRYPGTWLYIFEGGLPGLALVILALGRNARSYVGLNWCGEQTTVHNLCCLWNSDGPERVMGVILVESKSLLSDTVFFSPCCDDSRYQVVCERAPLLGVLLIQTVSGQVFCSISGSIWMRLWGSLYYLGGHRNECVLSRPETSMTTGTDREAGDKAQDLQTVLVAPSGCWRTGHVPPEQDLA